MKDFDIIIIGGGPAGSTAAYYLGLKGIKTLLIDKNRFPRDKPCGGGISIRTLTRFPYLKKSIQNIPVNWIYRVYLESPNGLSIEHTAKNPLYFMIRRNEFDNLLFNLAKKKVRVLENSFVDKIEISPQNAQVHIRGDRSYSCNIIIGADGINSIVARLSKLKTDKKRDTYAIVMQEETPFDNLYISPEKRNTMYVYYGIQGHYGYGYVFPKLHHINLGIGYRMDYYLKKIKRNPYENYLIFVDKLREDNLIQGNSLKKNFNTYTIPVGGPNHKTYTNRILLCGDAGGFVNAFTAEGIYYAMVSSECAARTAEDSIKLNDFSSKQFRKYELLWKKEIGLDLAKSVKIQRNILFNPNKIDRIVKAATMDQKLADLLTKYSIGEIYYYKFLCLALIRIAPLYLKRKIQKVFSRG